MNAEADYVAPYGRRRLLLLGGTGFIGRWLGRALSGARADLVCAVRDPARAAPIFREWGIDARCVEADLGRPEEAHALVRRERPDVVFDLAGYGVDPGEREETLAWRLNADLPEAIAQALAETDGCDWPGVRIVHTGSALEYGEAEGDLDEESTPKATTLYGRTKLAGTDRLRAACRARGLRGVTARLFTVYGPGERKGRLFPTLLEAAGSRDPVALTRGEQQRDFTWVGDVVEGLLRLGSSAAPPGGVCNLATGRLTAVRDFVVEVAAVLGIESERLRWGALPTRPEEMRHRPVTIERLRRTLGWTPGTSIREGTMQALAMRAELPGSGAIRVA